MSKYSSLIVGIVQSFHPNAPRHNDITKLSRPSDYHYDHTITVTLTSTLSLWYRVHNAIHKTFVALHIQIVLNFGVLEINAVDKQSLNCFGAWWWDMSNMLRDMWRFELLHFVRWFLETDILVKWLQRTCFKKPYGFVIWLHWQKTTNSTEQTSSQCFIKFEAWICLLILLCTLN